MSNGEIAIDQVLSANARQQGEQVRMIGVPVPGGAAGGIFNRIEGTATEVVAKDCELAEQVETTISQHYGVAMPEFLRH
jgi:hypothetical protein